VDSLLKSKVKGSGLEKYVKVSARVKNLTEEKIIDSYEIVM
jgi:metal-dependent HD superfamily phosphatase/phosphodiesterase